MKKRKWILLAISCLLLSQLTGCVWKSEHLKKVKELNGKINTLTKEKNDLQGRLDGKTRDLKKMTMNRDRLAALKKRLDSQLSNLSLRHKQCMEGLKASAAKGGALSQKLRQALLQVQRLQAIAAKRKALFDKLRLSFQAMVKAGKLRVSMVRGQLVVQLAEKILFSSGSSTLKREGKEAVADVTRILKDMKRRWQVAGHTDSKGSANGNWRLSSYRAMAVLKVMLKEGMPPPMISAAGFGQYQPAKGGDNETSEGRALNRRTELILIPDLRELQLAQNPSPFWACKALAMR